MIQTFNLHAVQTHSKVYSCVRMLRQKEDVKKCHVMLHKEQQTQTILKETAMMC